MIYLDHMTEAPHPAMVPQWTLGDRMRKARETAGLKQAELAERIGIGRSSIVNYESGRADPSRPVLLSWALATGVAYEWLAGEPSFRPYVRKGSTKTGLIRVTRAIASYRLAA